MFVHLALAISKRMHVMGHSMAFVKLQANATQRLSKVGVHLIGAPGVVSVASGPCKGAVREDVLHVYPARGIHLHSTRHPPGYIAFSYCSF